VIVAYEPLKRKLPGIRLTSEKKDHIIAYFLKELVKRFEDTQYTLIYTDGVLYCESACRILGIEHHVYTFGSWLHSVISLSCPIVMHIKRL